MGAAEMMRAAEIIQYSNVAFLKHLFAEYESDLVHGSNDFWVMYEFDENQIACDVWDCDVDKVELITRLMDNSYRMEYYINRCDMVNSPDLREKIGSNLRYDHSMNCWIFDQLNFEPVYHPELVSKEDAITFTIRYLYDFQRPELEVIYG